MNRTFGNDLDIQSDYTDKFEDYLDDLSYEVLEDGGTILFEDGTELSIFDPNDPLDYVRDSYEEEA